MKKGSFRVARRTVWTELSRLPKGSHKEALVYLFLETGPLTHWSGLFTAPIIDIGKYTRMEQDAVRLAIGSLSERGLIAYDHDRHLVYVSGLMARQAQYVPNRKQVTGLVRHIHGFDADSPAFAAFRDEQEERLELTAYPEWMERKAG